METQTAELGQLKAIAVVHIRVYVVAFSEEAGLLNGALIRLQLSFRLHSRMLPRLKICRDRG
jgi:hypothetical protein